MSEQVTVEFDERWNGTRKDVLFDMIVDGIHRSGFEATAFQLSHIVIDDRIQELEAEKEEIAQTLRNEQNKLIHLYTAEQDKNKALTELVEKCIQREMKAGCIIEAGTISQLLEAINKGES